MIADPFGSDPFSGFLCLGSVEPAGELLAGCCGLLGLVAGGLGRRAAGEEWSQAWFQACCFFEAEARGDEAVASA
jgi:hypothetical protein